MLKLSGRMGNRSTTDFSSQRVRFLCHASLSFCCQSSSMTSRICTARSLQGSQLSSRLVSHCCSANCDLCRCEMRITLIATGGGDEINPRGTGLALSYGMTRPNHQHDYEVAEARSVHQRKYRARRRMEIKNRDRHPTRSSPWPTSPRIC